MRCPVAWIPEYFLGDVLESVLQMVDSTGIIPLSKSYDIYGVVTQATGAGATSYGYTNEYLGGYNKSVFCILLFYDASLNRFLQPDTIVPGAGNPQAWNRYSYVGNNSISRNDPSGNTSCNKVISSNKPVSEEDCGDDALDYSEYIAPSPVAFWPPKPPGKDNKKDKNGLCNGPEIRCLPPQQVVHPTSIIPPTLLDIAAQAFCGVEHWTWGCTGTVLQDAATTVDLLGATGEAGLITVGCVDAGPPGCAAGLAASWVLWGQSGNPIETGLSWASTGATLFDDLSTPGSNGKNFATSLTGTLLGQVSPDPIIDLFIDGYESGYNHGVFKSMWESNFRP